MSQDADGGPDRPDFDVVVVGYGPVGMVTAALLGRAGHDVLVLERYAGLYNLPRGAIFDDETMRTLAVLGIADELLPKLRVQRNYEWRNAARQLLMEVDYAETGRSGWAEWYMMYQPELEEALDEVCRAQPSVRIRHSSPVVALAQDATRVTVSYGGDEPGSVTARYVVACDGGNSFVRRELGIDQDDYGFSEPWMVCDFRFTHPMELPAALQIGDPTGPTSVISIGPAHHRISFMLDSVQDFDVERDPEKVWRRVGRLGLMTPDDAELIRVATYTFRSLVAQHWRQGRILLAGDAAHEMPPFLGQGMCSGIRDAQNLGFKLDLVLRGKRPDALLDTYQSERDPHVRAVIEKGVEMGRRQTVRDPEQAAQRDRMLLAKRAANEAPDKIRFPGLGPGMHGPSAGAGSLSAQGVVEGADGRRARLDQAVGSGWQLLVDAAAVAGPVPAAAELAAIDVRVVRLGADAADVDGTYREWLAELGAVAVVVRPDFYVFGTAADAAALPGLVDDLLTATGERAPAPLSATG
ncbi:bifunctional 3-(3-hydroxy-phenyl)propionate/3-hydroxycinnamic acid hydroxylase [Pseudonocardia lacus]|uniref:bifunctional 3-(3-hydroxy-phenyl)propionate/3-hydroxycinnamic acid hydroxylase n=1 Tax=Pseudonocardia lacus TaxID=2835865 RepID=UPI001BDCD6D0|nr:bifunctional 3-(3-hydroxy-phenyl)propionate/3-hydroxycinnamic acid hydroxylase [Pseudonocardia lacus]